MFSLVSLNVGIKIARTKLNKKHFTMICFGIALAVGVIMNELNASNLVIYLSYGVLIAIGYMIEAMCKEIERLKYRDERE